MKGEQIDEKLLKEFRLDYTVSPIRAAATPRSRRRLELISGLKSSGGFMVTFLAHGRSARIIPVGLGASTPPSAASRSTTRPTPMRVASS